MRIIGGTARGRAIEAPEGKDTRPTLDRVRENLFNIIRHDVYDARVLDLFAGSGALSFEALSRGAASAVLVDRDRAAHLCEKKNAEKLGMADRARLLLIDWTEALCRLRQEDAHFDLVFLDPPYAMQDLTEPTRALLPLLTQEALLVVEHRAGTPSLVAEGYTLVDSRHYGIAGLSLYRLAAEGGPWNVSPSTPAASTL